MEECQKERWILRKGVSFILTIGDGLLLLLSAKRFVVVVVVVSVAVAVVHPPLLSTTTNFQHHQLTPPPNQTNIDVVPILLSVCAPGARDGRRWTTSLDDDVVGDGRDIPTSGENV